jgi:hypothetical protein
MRRNGHIRERSLGLFEVRYAIGTDTTTGRRKIATATVRGSCNANAIHDLRQGS